MADPARGPVRPPIDVTVSVVCHSNRELVLSCLRALQDEQDRTSLEIEIVVLDNASDDGSAEAIREAFPRVRLIEQLFRAGFGANHNTVIRSSESRFVFLLNDDADVRRGALETLARHLEEHPETVAAGPRIVGLDEQTQQTAWKLLTPGQAALQALTLGRVRLALSRGEQVRRVGQISACAMMVRRQQLEEVGGFDEGYFMYLEDSDLCLRLGGGGKEIHYVPQAEVLHHSRQSSGAAPERRIREQARSQLLYWQKHHSRLGALLARGAMTFAYLTRGAIGAALRCLPARVRPRRAANWPPREFLRTAWALIGPQRGPGLRESAEAWNREHRAR